MVVESGLSLHSGFQSFSHLLQGGAGPGFGALCLHCGFHFTSVSVHGTGIGGKKSSLFGGIGKGK